LALRRIKNPKIRNKIQASLKPPCPRLKKKRQKEANENKIYPHTIYPTSSHVGGGRTLFSH
jgi:hypothetical protein